MEQRIDIPEGMMEEAPQISLSRRGILQGLAAGTVFPFIQACTTNPITGANQLILPGFDNATLAAMSTSAWSEMKQQTPQSSDRRLVGRVNEIWTRTANGRTEALRDVYGQNVPYNPNDWEVAVFDTDDVNAFVMPGQQVGVYRGITELTENDDQLASVLGHEAGHIDGRHSAARASANVASQVALVAGQVAVANSDTMRQFGPSLAALGGAAVQFGVLLPYSRQHELEADKLGVDYMHRAGYDVGQAPRLWELMAAQSQGNRPPEFMSTHPDPNRRADELRRYINARGYDLV
ncbi:MAG: M48 family metallopeptidase [Pseudomonadota bacterium]